jgi:hypothetical protein
MLAPIDKGKPNEAHPIYWAPFVMVPTAVSAGGRHRHAGIGNPSQDQTPPLE